LKTCSEDGGRKFFEEVCKFLPTCMTSHS